MSLLEDSFNGDKWLFHLRRGYQKQHCVEVVCKLLDVHIQS